MDAATGLAARGAAFTVLGGFGVGFVGSGACDGGGEGAITGAGALSGTDESGPQPGGAPDASSPAGFFALPDDSSTCAATAVATTTATTTAAATINFGNRRHPDRWSPSSTMAPYEFCLRADTCSDVGQAGGRSHRAGPGQGMRGVHGSGIRR